MDFLKVILFSIFVSTTLTGCLFTYLIKSSWHQSKILKSRVPIEEALEDKSLSEDVKRKLHLAQEARKYAEAHLKLSETDNYKSYVKLERPYVTYVVRAAKEYELKPHLWWFPLVGKMPYKGYFSKEGAKEEADQFDPKEFDTYVRGVTAYSTLGWFDDPLLSSMMSYSDYGLVETVIHETVHATVFIKNKVDFNERLATYLGREGARLFYLDKEGPESATLKEAQLKRSDDLLFSKFISAEIKSLKAWYKSEKGKITPDSKKIRIAQIQTQFKKSTLPKMKTDRYGQFDKIELNNARLLSYETYVSDLSDFEKLFEKLGGDFSKILDYCKKLEEVDDPIKTIKDFIK